MEINIQSIADEKIKAMHESGLIQLQIEDGISKLILKSVEDALTGYSLKRAVEEKISAEVSQIAANLNFSSYNTFIADKVKQLLNEHLKEDVTAKISAQFEKIFIFKRDSIKLSEIFEAYRDMLISGLDEMERYELNNKFYSDIEESQYGWLECSISEKEPKDNYGSYSKKCACEFSFTVHKKHDNKQMGWISTVYFEGRDIRNRIELSPRNEFETLIINLLYNETPIEIDIEDSDDIDRSLGLDI